MWSAAALFGLSSFGFSTQEIRSDLKELVEGFQFFEDKSEVAGELYENLLAFEDEIRSLEKKAQDFELVYGAIALIEALPPGARPSDYSALDQYSLAWLILSNIEEHRSYRFPIAERLVYLAQEAAYHELVLKVANTVRTDGEIPPTGQFAMRISAAESALALDSFEEAAAYLREADGYLDRISATAAQEARLSIARGNYGRILGNLDEALEEVTQARKLIPSIPALLRNRVEILYCDTLLSAGFFERATEEIEELLSRPERFTGEEAAELGALLALCQHGQALKGALSPETASESLRKAVQNEDLNEDDRDLLRISRLELEVTMGDRESAHGTRKIIEERAERRRPTIEARLAAALHRLSVLDGDERLQDVRLTQLRTCWDSVLTSATSNEADSAEVGFLEYAPQRFVVSELIFGTMLETPGDRGVARALQRLVSAQETGSFSRRAGYTPKPLRDVLKTWTGPEQALLLLLPGVRETHAFLATEQDLQYIALPPPYELLALGKSWISELTRLPAAGATGGRETVHALGRPLARKLLPPQLLDSLSECRDITVVGSAYLPRIPMEYLPIGDDLRSGFFGDRFALSHLPTLPVGQVLRDRRFEKKGRHSVVVLAAPDLTSSTTLTALPLEPVRSRLLEELPEEETLLLVGKDATSEALSSSAIEGARLLHIYTHGFILGNERRRAALALTPTNSSNGFVDSEFIEAHVKPPPVVLLSACSAGAGRLIWGTDRSSDLGSAFLAAGAVAVVQSPVALHADVQASFTAHFQESLLQGSSVREAVHDARRAVASKEATAHPYYGRIQVMGDGDHRPFPPR